MQLSFKAPCAKLEKLENLWLQLSKVACNIKCKHCYLDCHQDTRKKNFLNIDKIQMILSSNFKSLNKIFITGGEPFLHPKINDILHMCLKKSDVVIFSNGTLLNEKKIKVLKNIEDMSNHKILFRFSLDHFSEGRNDEYRSRGVFKKVINALKLTQKYNFYTDIVCVNLKNEDEIKLQEGFMELFKKHELKLSDENLKIVPMLKMGSYAKYYNITDTIKNVSFQDIEDFNMEWLDCKNSRVVTADGIYSCPALVNDPRGKLGDELHNASKEVYLETQTCYNCVSRKNKLFG